MYRFATLSGQHNLGHFTKCTETFKMIIQKIINNIDNFAANILDICHQ